MVGDSRRLRGDEGERGVGDALSRAAEGVENIFTRYGPSIAPEKRELEEGGSAMVDSEGEASGGERARETLMCIVLMPGYVRL